MADEDDDDKRKLDEAEVEAEEGSPEDVVAGPGAGDPRIMTMTGAPAVNMGPGNAAPEMMRRNVGGPAGPMGAQGAHPGFLQQLFAQIQAAHQARQAQRQQMGQQFMGSPMGQQFAQSPFGQQMLQRHSQWAPAAPAAGGGAPQNIVMGDHTGQPGPAAMPPTAAAQANAEATQAKQAAPQAQAQGGARAAQQPAAAAAPQRQVPPRGVMQRPEQPMQRPTFGGNASASIQQEIQRRLAGGGRRGLG
jgi:hypothetical protein